MVYVLKDVPYLLRDEEAGGSNPLTPTIKKTLKTLGETDVYPVIRRNVNLNRNPDTVRDCKQRKRCHDL